MQSWISVKGKRQSSNPGAESILAVTLDDIDEDDEDDEDEQNDDSSLLAPSERRSADAAAGDGPLAAAPVAPKKKKQKKATSVALHRRRPFPRDRPRGGSRNHPGAAVRIASQRAHS